MPQTKTIKTLFILLMSLVASGLFAAEPLRVDHAFPQEIRVKNKHIELKIAMRDNYYLYQHAFSFSSGDDALEIGDVSFPPSKSKYDEFIGEAEIFDKDIQLNIPFKILNAANNSIIFTYSFQGCLDQGICYPPTTRTVVLDPNGTSSFIGTPIPAGERNVNNLIDDAFDSAPENFAQHNAPALISDTPEETKDLLDVFGSGNSGEDNILPVDKAFQLTVDVTSDGYLLANWFAEPGYYLYQNKLTFESDNDAIAFGVPVFPPAKLKDDEIFGETPVYFGAANVRIPISKRPDKPTAFTLIANYQGCKENSICYPPSVTQVNVNLPIGVVADSSSANLLTSQALAEHDDLANKVLSGNLWLTVFSFLLFGLALTFTPCVLPMVPILSGVISGSGEKQITTRKAFNLSVVYVLAMALLFTLAGVATAKLGQNMQAAFQHPVIIISFSLLFVAFALSMFGLFEIQMPASIQTKLAQISNKQESGSYIGAAVMGALSALIVGPCVTPPLSAALLVIADHGDVVRGGVSLFALAIGMGVPLVIFGTSMGKILPRAGAWMDHVKTFFGLLMLGLAIWMLARILPDSITLILWALLALLTAVFAGALKPLAGDSTLLPQLFKALGWLALFYSAILFIGALTGAHDPLKPLSNLSSNNSSSHQEIQFKRIKTLANLEDELELAASNQQKVFLDFYADWCIACKEMEKYSFSDLQVQDNLANWVLLQADVTPNDERDKELMQGLKVPGPPAMLFFDRNGKEVRAMRLYGFKKPGEFLKHLQRLP